jgi:hypothetical protein
MYNERESHIIRQEVRMRWEYHESYVNYSQGHISNDLLTPMKFHFLKVPPPHITTLRTTFQHMNVGGREGGNCESYPHHSSLIGSLTMQVLKSSYFSPYGAKSLNKVQKRAKTKALVNGYRWMKN